MCDHSAHTQQHMCTLHRSEERVHLARRVQREESHRLSQPKLEKVRVNHHHVDPLIQELDHHQVTRLGHHHSGQHMKDHKLQLPMNLSDMKLDMYLLVEVFLYHHLQYLYHLHLLQLLKECLLMLLQPGSVKRMSWSTICEI